MSIKPEFALEIFKGTKKFEYRRTIFREPVERIIVYASSPIQMVIGEFLVKGILFEDLRSLWSKTKHHSGISKRHFDLYFSDKEKGYAIKVGKRTRYQTPQPLHALYGIRPPQSFAYIDR
ncbi:MAG: hypothetical protein M3298_02935 [Thermoproteota archaeon]|nr:hypothetical protein [Thermoproteota archaeon]